MGISVEQYRARIGLAGFAPVNRGSRLIQGQAIVFRKLPLTMSVLTVLLSLLALSGDIESNPGPGDQEESTQNSGAMATSQDIQDLKLEFSEMMKSIQVVMADVKELKTGYNQRLENVEKKTVVIDGAIEKLEDEVIQLKTKLSEKNLILWGIPDSAGETASELEDKVRNFIEDDLNVSEEVEIMETWRQGSAAGNRLVVARFGNLRQKKLVIDSAKSKPEFRRRVKNDLPYEVRKARQTLAPFFKSARDRREAPKIVGRKIQINGKMFKFDSETKQLVETKSSAPSDVK